MLFHTAQPVFFAAPLRGCASPFGRVKSLASKRFNRIPYEFRSHAAAVKLTLMGKLIRDRIPELLGEHSGKHRLLSDEEFEPALRAKLQEEVQEYLESGELMELADILEVVYALAKLDGITESQLDALRAEKIRERGAFEQRLWWDGE